MRVFPPVGYSFCLWATLPLLFAFLSIWLCSQSLVCALCSHVAHLSSVHRKFCVLVTVTCSVSDYPLAGPLPSSAIFQPVFRQVSLPGFFKALNAAGEAVCVWAAFRPLVGWAGSALLPGCCWRSTQAFRHSPSLAGQDSPSTPQAPPCPRTPAPPQLHRDTERGKSLWFILHIKKNKNRFWRGPQCNLWWCCIVCLHTTCGLVMI